MMRSGLISMIYDQTIEMTEADLTDSAAITLMGTDVEWIVANLKNLHEAWATIMEVGIAIWLLKREIGVACFIPLVISLGNNSSSHFDRYIGSRETAKKLYLQDPWR